MIRELRERYIDYRRKKALLNIRSNFVVFGFNVSDMSDEEIEQGLVKAQRVIASAGFTADEAIRAFQLLQVLGE